MTGGDPSVDETVPLEPGEHVDLDSGVRVKLGYDGRMVTIDAGFRNVIVPREDVAVIAALVDIDPDVDE